MSHNEPNWDKMSQNEQQGATINYNVPKSTTQRPKNAHTSQ